MIWLFFKCFQIFWIILRAEEDHLQDETLVCLCIHEFGPWLQLDEGCDQQQQAEQMLVEIAAVSSGPLPAWSPLATMCH